MMKSASPCLSCDWNGRSSGVSAQGDLIYCEAYSQDQTVLLISDCPSYTTKERLPEETKLEFDRRNEKETREIEAHAIAKKASTRSSLSLAIAFLALLISLGKLVFDILTRS